ncbi:MAG: hypothetical protein HZB26_01305 [Candidatus Hydrogenedentes bacterium]|nr:hypothetical protein [Candidatus Hydrogenedentota bacterium]
MEIKISRSARSCAACAREFVHEEPLHSAIRIQDLAFVREDFCDACWTAERANGTFSAWKARFFDPRVAEQEPPEVFSPLRQAFYEAAESEDREQMAKAYLAAMLLRRQKVFRLIKESDAPDGEARVALFADRIGDRLIEVRDPNLTAGEMQAGRRLLMERLNQLENPESTDSPVSAESHGDVELQEA